MSSRELCESMTTVSESSEGANTGGSAGPLISVNLCPVTLASRRFLLPANPPGTQLLSGSAVLCYSGRWKAGRGRGRGLGWDVVGGRCCEFGEVRGQWGGCCCTMRASGVSWSDSSDNEWKHSADAMDSTPIDGIEYERQCASSCLAMPSGGLRYACLKRNKKEGGWQSNSSSRRGVQSDPCF